MQGYVAVLRTPGLRVPLLATVIGALPLGMLGLSLLLYAEELTGSLAVGGFAAAAFGLGNAAGLSAQGRLIDRHGQSRVVSAAGVACAACGFFLVTVAPAVDWPGFVVVAGAGMGISIPATTGSMRVLLAELVAEGTARTAGYALLAVLFQLAVLTGPLATSLLLAAAGPGAAVLVGGLLACGAALLFARSRASRSWRPSPDRAGSAGVRGGTGLTVLLSIMAGAGVSAGVVAVAVPAAALSLGSPGAGGVLLAASAAGEIIAGLALGAISWRWSQARLLLGALAGSAVAVGLVAWAAHSLVLLFPALFLVGVCGAPAAIASSALLDTLAPRSALTRAYTLMVSVWLLGSAVGNSMGGVAAGHLGPRQALALGACWLAAPLVAAALLRRALDVRR
ncbi:MFS transporter [Streptomyces sp. NPDC127098]|uniref:MFS transporter n=1 Tax=Streptomyces sp. NPDC127098 TaxID=3347137 RepID=UPI00365E081C